MFDEGGILNTMNTFIAREATDVAKPSMKNRKEDDASKPLIQSYRDLEEEKVPDVATLLMSPRMSKK